LLNKVVKDEKEGFPDEMKKSPQMLYVSAL
jgi:hypothetical protein